MALPFGVTMACRTRRSVAPAWRSTRPRLSSFATFRLTVVGEIDDPDRAAPFDADQQRKQRAIERYAGFPNHPLVALGAVHNTDDVQQGRVQSPDPFGHMCISHSFS
jgi:hypothetical protein